MRCFGENYGRRFFFFFFSGGELFLIIWAAASHALAWTLLRPKAWELQQWIYPCCEFRFLTGIMILSLSPTEKAFVQISPCSL